MKLFQFLQKKLSLMGIIPNQEQNQLFNGRIQIGFVCFWGINTSNVMILFHKAKSFNEYTDSIFVTAATTGVAVNYTIMMFNKTKWFKFIEFAEEITSCGKSNIKQSSQSG